MINSFSHFIDELPFTTDHSGIQYLDEKLVKLNLPEDRRKQLLEVKYKRLKKKRSTRPPVSR